MKGILIIAIALLTNMNCLFAQDIDCTRQANFGNNKICIPKIYGYEECYSDSIVKLLADGTEVPTNVVLGFYLNNKTYEKKDSLGLIDFDDYFKIYGTIEIQNNKADYQLLDQMLKILSKNFVAQNWDEISKEIDKIGFEAEIGVPIVIEKYKINKESFTFIMLTKYEFEGIEPYTLAMSMNGYLRNNRLIWMAYYLNYHDQETIEKLKQKSNIILERLIDSSE